jgi:hypothetical protein
MRGERFVVLAGGILFAEPRYGQLLINNLLAAIIPVMIGGWIAFRYASLLFDPTYPVVALGG